MKNLTERTDQVDPPVKNTETTVPRFITSYRFFLLVLFFTFSWITAHHHFLLFHTLEEMFSIIVGCVVFVITWNSQRFIKNGYLSLIGIAYLFVAVIDSFHTLNYKGLSIFIYENPVNIGAQLWIAARFMEAFSLLAGFWFLNRKVNFIMTFLCYAFSCVLLILSIMYWEIFPDCFTGELTLFKIVSEYLIVSILIITVFLLYQKKAVFAPYVFKLILWASVI
ncbi:MAG: hypothetical protein OEY59_08380, partial [Deltaproteobacteria bacterium]|nr:hypothetical protein [Deltaproteobacteria bacterium]